MCNFLSHWIDFFLLSFLRKTYILREDKGKKKEGWGKEKKKDL